MNPTAARPDESGWYQVRLRGRLEPRWSAWLDGVGISPGAHGTTVLTGYVVDQSALHGLLTRIRDLGLPLISVARVEPDSGRGAAPPPPTESPTDTDNPTGD